MGSMNDTQGNMQGMMDEVADTKLDEADQALLDNLRRRQEYTNEQPDLD